MGPPDLTIESGDDGPRRAPSLPIVRTHQRIVEPDARGLVGEDIVRAVDVRGLLRISLGPAVRVVDSTRWSPFHASFISLLRIIVDA